jgi:glycogen(starch) synthase
MRVLLLTWEFPPARVGGPGRHVHSLATALVHAGHDVTVATPQQAGTASGGSGWGVRLLRATPGLAAADPAASGSAEPAPDRPSLNQLRAVNRELTLAILRAASGGRFDVIHAHDWRIAHSAVAVKQRLNVPLVATMHATEAGRNTCRPPDGMDRSAHSMQCWLGHEAGAVLVCSEYMRREVTRLLGVAQERVQVVPDGVDCHEWQARPGEILAARLRYAGADGLIGYAGRLVYEKGVQDIVAALPELRLRHPGLRLVVAGHGPYRATLIEQIRRLRLYRAVSLAGFLSAELAAVMGASDAMVVPSAYEPTGRTVLEAAAAGVPVAAAATGGLTELVHPGRTGVTFQARDPAALARAVSVLLSDRDGAQVLARAARNLVADRHSWTAISAAVAGTYKELADAPALSSST